MYIGAALEPRVSPKHYYTEFLALFMIIIQFIMVPIPVKNIIIHNNNNYYYTSADFGGK